MEEIHSTASIFGGTSVDRKDFSSPKSKTHANVCHQKAHPLAECHNNLATTKCCNLLTNSLQTSRMTSNPWLKLQNNFSPLNVIL